MAGAGYKLFNTGDVLTAAQVNTYLQEQVVMVFNDATARTTALSGVLAEGMVSYLKNTDAVEIYNGSAWVGIAADQTPLTTKGDLFTYSTTDARLGVGNDGETLVADSSTTTGLKWQSSNGPAFRATRITSNQSITTATFTKVQFNDETFDTDNCFDKTTNYRFTPTRAGYYQLNATIYPSGASLTRSIVIFYKNGGAYARTHDDQNVNNNYYLAPGSTIMYLNGTTDYAEVYCYLTGTSLVINYGSDLNEFSGCWLRS